MKFVIDTNVLIFKSRNSTIWKYIEKTYFPRGIKNNAIISFAAQAESLAFANQQNWGTEKKLRLNQTINLLEIIHSNQKKLIDFYVNIDAFSHNRHKSLSLPKKFTARKMGKNDLWIAATAATLQCPLITTDKDFEHLDGVFLDVIYIDVEKILN